MHREAWVKGKQGQQQQQSSQAPAAA